MFDNVILVAESYFGYRVFHYSCVTYCLCPLFSMDQSAQKFAER